MSSPEESSEGVSDISKGSSIQVSVRVRPLVRRERENQEKVFWACENNSIQDVNGDKTFHFDHLFTPEHTTDDIYREVISEIVANAMLGYHGSVFSYGQTASGELFVFYSKVFANYT